MKRIFGFLFAWVIGLSVWAQSGEGYNPENPADPTMYYFLTMEAAPRTGGSVGRGRVAAAVGQTVHCEATAKVGYTFKQWMIGDSLVSTERYFSYTMPAHDVAMVAYFEYTGYNPENPGDPFIDGYKHNVTLYATPSVGGYFNSASFMLTEGEVSRIYAYPRNGYKFESWMQGSTVVSTDNPLTIRMGTQDVEYKAIFTYNPENPADPFANTFNKETGEVVIDNFMAGSLNSALSNAVGGMDYSTTVKSIKVIGKLNPSDFGFARHYTNCETIDLSRTTGYIEVPSYSFESASALKTIYLPINVETIGEHAFMECSALKELYIYSPIPPTLGEEVFYNAPTDMTIYVPSGAVELYRTTEGWKNLNIKPLDGEEYSFTVNFPSDATMSEYKNMTLELVNVQSGQVYKYLVTDRHSYTFYALMKNTIYDVFLKNAMGEVLAELSNIMLEEKDVNISFTTIKKMYDVSLTVLTPEGDDVTSMVDITWYDNQGTYLRQGSVIKGIVEGRNLQYRIKNDGDLALEYAQPMGMNICVADENGVVHKLSRLEKIDFAGRIVDANTKRGIRNATVSLSQTINKSNNKTQTVKTDEKGYYSLIAYNAPCKLKVAAYDYVTQTIHADSFEIVDRKAEIPNIKLSPLKGATINLSHTYTESVEEGVTPNMQNWFTDYANITYDVYNVSKSKPLTQVSYRYPQLVLLDDAEVGDSLWLIASSRRETFMPVTVGMTVDSTGVFDAVFGIKQLGQIMAKYDKTENASVVGLLFDDEGQLQRKGSYNSQNIVFTELKDGVYHLVAMGKNDKYNSIHNLSRFLSLGLTEDVDYIKTKIEVESGVIKKTSFDKIPYFDESKFSYIEMGNSSLHASQSSITVGNYVTLIGNLDIISERDELSNLEFIVDLPSTAVFIENSVMIGEEVTSNYSLKGNTLTISLEEYKKGDKIKFCIVPTEGGEYTPDAFIAFVANERQIELPMGNSSYIVEALSINVPLTTTSKNIHINGVVPAPNSVVEVYDNDVLIANATPLANGSWETECELCEPYNLSNHKICAKVITKSGLEYNSDIQLCTYDINAVYVDKVAMYYNGVENVFDFINPTQKVQTYSYSSDSGFTFTLEFNVNDANRISDVILYVKTLKNEWFPLYPKYNEKKGVWITTTTSEKLGNSYPVNVSVDFHAETAPVLDLNMISDAKESLIDICLQYEEYADLIQSTDDEQDIDSIYVELGEAGYNALSYDSIAYNQYLEEMSLEELEALLEEESLNIDLDSINDRLLQVKALMNPISEHDFYLENGSRVISKECGEIVEEELLEQGYTKVATTNGAYIYFLSTDSVYAYIDSTSGMYYEVLIPADELASYATATRTYEGVMSILEWHDKIQGALNVVRDAYEDLQERIGNLGDALDRDWDDLEKKISEDTKKWQAYREAEKQIELKIKKGEYASDDELQKLKKKVEAFQESQKKLNDQIKASKHQRRLIPLAKNCVKALMPALEQILPIAKYVDIAANGYNAINTFANLYAAIDKLDPCPANPTAPTQLRTITTAGAGVIGTMLVTKLGVESALDFATAGQVLAAPATGGASLGTAFITVLTKMVAGITIDAVYEKLKNDRISEIEFAINSTKCEKKEDDKPNDEPTPEQPKTPESTNKKGGGKHKPRTPDSKPAIDPAGYVYEGVSSNRIEGVMASCYYKETQEDEYGIIQDKAVLWDAEEYAQENPLFTDENGMYQWFVPQGLWQVKFEKEGYETTYSEWLPVPPPQLEVNIAMVQNKQPEVKTVHAYEDGIVVEFDKYMQPATLNTDNIFVVQNGEKVAGTVTMLNEEIAYRDSSVVYVSKVRFVYEQPITAEEVTLTVSNRVKSYAGLQMQDTYTQTFDIEKEIKAIVADSLVTMYYGGEYALTVKAQPAEAAAGKTLTVNSLSPMILTVATESIVLDDNGEAIVKVYGELPGTAAVNYSIVGYDYTASTIVKVDYEDVDVTANPTASIASGTTVEKGTEVTLYCATEGAVIYYTLDGSCPCDESALQYDGTPIVINEDTELRIMAVAEGRDESDVVVYYYYVKEEVKMTATPTASIASGTTVEKGTEVALNCTTEGAIIYYTLDGSSPQDKATQYNGTPIIINNNTELHIMAVAEGYSESDVVVYYYYVEGDVKMTANPAASIASGTTVEKGTEVTLSCATEGAFIYYTLDGSSPLDEDTQIRYDGTPIVINEDTELRIMAVAEGYAESYVVTYYYYIAKEEDPTLIEVNIYKKWDDVLICDNSAYELVAYQWYKNDMPIDGETNQYYSEEGGLDGSYYVMAKDTDGNWGKSNTIICQKRNNSKLKVTPTVVKKNEKCMVTINRSATNGEVVYLNVFNAMGQMIREIRMYDHSVELEFDNSGPYFIKAVELNGNMESEKIIVIE